MEQPKKLSTFFSIPDFKPSENAYKVDGLWYCGACKTPLQTIVEGVGAVRVDCTCKKKEKERKAAIEAREAREKARKKAFERDRSKRFDFTFASDDRRSESASYTLKKYCENFKEHRNTGTGFVIYSNQNGSGKTFLACAVANDLIDRGYNILVTDFLTLRDKLFNPGAFSFVTRVDVLNTLCAYDLIVIDDLGTEQSSEFMLEVEYRVIDALTDAMVPLILTTNYTIADLKNTTDISKRRVFDRLLGSCALLSVDQPNGKSRRVERCIELTKEMMEGAPCGT